MNDKKILFTSLGDGAVVIQSEKLINKNKNNPSHPLVSNFLLTLKNNDKTIKTSVEDNIKL